MDLPYDGRNRELFEASTIVLIGDGKTTSFWSSSWMDHEAPISMPPRLFRKSKRKKLSVYNTLKENRWVAHILPLQTPEEIHEYVALWEREWYSTRGIHGRLYSLVMDTK